MGPLMCHCKHCGSLQPHTHVIASITGIYSSCEHRGGGLWSLAQASLRVLWVFAALLTRLSITGVCGLTCTSITVIRGLTKPSLLSLLPLLRVTNPKGLGKSALHYNPKIFLLFRHSLHFNSIYQLVDCCRFTLSSY